MHHPPSIAAASLALLAAACGSPTAPASEPAAPPARAEPATTAEPEPVASPEPDEPAEPAKATPADLAAARRACVKTHEQVLRDPDATAAQLAEAAHCFRDASGISAEIAILEQLVRRHPHSPEARDAVRDSGRAYEAAYHIAPQDHYLADAARSYEEYARRYGGEDDAAAVMVRAACIRHRLGHDRELRRDLGVLDRLRHHRRSNAVKSGEEACAQTPPLPTAPLAAPDGS